MSSEAEQFEQMMLALQSQDNNLRKAAEAKYQETKANNPMWLFQALVELSGTSQNILAQQLSLLELRKILNNKDFSFQSFNASAIEHVKQRALAIIGNTHDAKVRTHAAEVIASIASNLYVENGPGWDELWPLLLETMTNNSAEVGVRAGCCRVFQEIPANVVTKGLKNNHQRVAAAFAAVIQGDHIELSLVTMVALIGLLGHVAAADKKCLQTYSEVIPMILQSLANMLNAQRYADAKELGIVMCELVETAPEVFRNHTKVLLEGMMNIASQFDVSSEVRFMAIEVMLTYCESEPKTIRKVPNFAQSLFDLLFRYMQNPTFEDDWHLKPTESAEEDLEDATDCEVGASGMDRLARSLKAKHIQAIASQTIAANIKSPDPRLRLAACNAMTYIAEACRDDFRPQMGLILDFVTPLLQDESQYIRHSAVLCINQMCSDFAPDFQHQFYETILLSMASVFNDCPRIQGLAAACINTFFEDQTNGEDEEEDADFAKKYAPFVPQVFAAVVPVMRSSPHMFVRKECVDAMGSLCEFCKDAVVPYIDSIVPEFQALLQLDETQYQNSKEVIVVKSQALQSTTLLAAAVKLPAFGKYAVPVCDYLSQMLDFTFPVDDPRATAMFRAWVCMAECMKAEIMPYVPKLLQHLFNWARFTSDYEFIDDLPGQDVPDAPEGTYHARIFTKEGEKLARVKTYEVELKTLSLNCLTTLVEEIGFGLSQYLDEIAVIAMQSVAFKTLVEVRKEASELISLAVKAYNSGAPQQIPGIANSLVPQLMDLLMDEPDHGIVQSLWDNMNVLLECVPVNVLPPEIVDKTAKTLLMFINDGLKRRADIEGARKETDADDEEVLERLQEEEELEDDLLEVCYDAVGNMLRKCPGFVPHYTSQYLKVVYILMNRSNPLDEQMAGISILSKFLESGVPECLGMLNDIASGIMPYAQSGDSSFMQAGFYCCGMIVALGPQNPSFALQAFAQTMYETLKSYFSSANSTSVEWEYTTCSAVNAATKLMEAAPQVCDLNAMWGALINVLPATGDEDETDEVHARMANWILSGHSLVADGGLRAALIPKLKEAEEVSKETKALIERL